jgi:hypothetical protein
VIVQDQRLCCRGLPQRPACPGRLERLIADDVDLFRDLVDRAKTPRWITQGAPRNTTAVAKTIANRAISVRMNLLTSFSLGTSGRFFGPGRSPLRHVGLAPARRSVGLGRYSLTLARPFPLPPEKSSRAIAAQIGVSYDAVQRARKSGNRTLSPDVAETYRSAFLHFPIERTSQIGRSHTATSRASFVAWSVCVP